jgi:CDGSH-type Zn-finger protein
MSTPIVLKNLMGATLPNYERVNIENVIALLKKINTHPEYQREIRWSIKSMIDFIGTIMDNGLIPGITNYKLQKCDKECHTYKYETIDGQHRLFVIDHFRNAKYVELPNKKPFLIHWNYYNKDTERYEPVFYEPTDAIKQWEIDTGLTAYYMNDESKDRFDEYPLEIRTITHILSLQQRREIFCSLQNGVPVRNSDLLKNYTENKFINFLSENGYEKNMKRLINQYCSKKADRFWVQWITRLYLLFNAIKSGRNCDVIFIHTDNYIQKMIKGFAIELQTSPFQEETFNNAFIRFQEFLDRLYDFGIKFNPTQFFALFTHLSMSETGREEILLSNMWFWSNNGIKNKRLKKMWEASVYTQDERRKYFNDCLTQLDDFKVPAEEIERKPITKKLKKEVWMERFGDCETGICGCGKEINKSNCEYGHIKAHSMGGLTQLENLRPVCMKCNREMGTRNMEEFFHDIYPIEYIE